MDGWRIGWTEGWGGGWDDGWTDGGRDGWNDGRLRGWVEGEMGAKMDGQMKRRCKNGWRVGWMERWMDRGLDGRIEARRAGWRDRDVDRWWQGHMDGGMIFGILSPSPLQVVNRVSSLADHGGEVPPGPQGAPESGQDKWEERGRGEARHRSKRLWLGPLGHLWGVLWRAGESGPTLLALM